MSRAPADLRRDYDRAVLLERGRVTGGPGGAVRPWFQEAPGGRLVEPNAMTLATVDAEAGRRARMVLLKGVDARGFVFYTNYESRKARRAGGQPAGGAAASTGPAGAPGADRGRGRAGARGGVDAYFATRPPRQPDRRVGVAAERGDRRAATALDARVRGSSSAFGDGAVPRPPHWGGYRVGPERDRVLAGPAGAACTTGCDTPAKTEAMAGSASGWRRDLKARSTYSGG